MALVNSAAELVGNTPLLRARKLEKQFALSAHIFAKLEYFNPAGSVKDRISLSIIEDALEKGSLKPGGTVIEPTSGNTGIGLAAVAAAKGLRAVIVMPDSMSAERVKLIKAYGAEVVLTPGALGMQGAIDKAQALQREISGAIIAGQFTNPVNPATHRATTGPEIWRDLEGKADIFVAGVGTGGTISGTAAFLKEKNCRAGGLTGAQSGQERQTRHSRYRRGLCAADLGQNTDRRGVVCRRSRGIQGGKRLCRKRRDLSGHFRRGGASCGNDAGATRGKQRQKHHSVAARWCGQVFFHGTFRCGIGNIKEVKKKEEESI